MLDAAKVAALVARHNRSARDFLGIGRGGGRGLALPLGGRFHVPHGVITGCFAGEMMRYSAPACAEQLAEFGAALGWDRLEAQDFAARLDELAEQLGLRALLRRTKVSAEMVAAMARDAMANRRLMDPNPRQLTEADVAHVYRVVLEIR